MPVAEAKYPACSLLNDCLSLVDFRFVALELAGSTCDINPNGHGHNMCVCFKSGRFFTQLVRFRPGVTSTVGACQGICTTYKIPLLREIKESKKLGLAMRKIKPVREVELFVD